MPNSIGPTLMTRLIKDKELVMMLSSRITSEALYEELRKDVIPRHNFFIGIDDTWSHKHECIRINYAKDELTLRKSLEVIKRIISE